MNVLLCGHVHRKMAESERQVAALVAGSATACDTLDGNQVHFIELFVSGRKVVKCDRENWKFNGSTFRLSSRESYYAGAFDFPSYSIDVE